MCVSSKGPNIVLPGGKLKMLLIISIAMYRCLNLITHSVNKCKNFKEMLFYL